MALRAGCRVAWKDAILAPSSARRPYIVVWLGPLFFGTYALLWMMRSQ